MERSASAGGRHTEPAKALGQKISWSASSLPGTGKRLPSAQLALRKAINCCETEGRKTNCQSSSSKVGRYLAILLMIRGGAVPPAGIHALLASTLSSPMQMVLPDCFSGE